MGKRGSQHQLNVILKRLMLESDVDDIRLAKLTDVPFTRKNREIRDLFQQLGLILTKLVDCQCYLTALNGMVQGRDKGECRWA